MSDLLERTTEFALSVIELFRALPEEDVAAILGRNLLRSGTAVGAQYREAQRTKATPEFVRNLEAVLRELEGTRYWLELLERVDVFSRDRVEPLLFEATELIAILMTIAKNAKRR